MRTDIVLTLTGTDRVGIVEEVTRVLLDLGGNVGTSRMARLGGEFAILALVSLPKASLGKLDSAFAHISAQGYKVTVSETAPAVAYEGWAGYRVVVSGADHEGIVYGIASGLSSSGITIESAETSTVQASVTGTPLFTMVASILVPPSLAETDWMSALEDAAQDANVDVEVSIADRG
ncbi:MAG: transcriptional regulator [Coriobacteriia bacterium]|nr:transcriptional regulator [Coriobacteriia bacterium]